MDAGVAMIVLHPRRTAVVLAVLFASACQPLPADDPASPRELLVGPMPVGRVTVDRDADLLEALWQARRFEDALRLCRMKRTASVSTQTDEAALWAIRLSQTLTSQLAAGPEFGAKQIRQAQQPVEELLEAYPDHARRWFLEAQRLAVDREATIHTVYRAAITPVGSPLRDDAMRRLLRSTRDQESLAAQVAEERSRLESAKRGSDRAMVAQLTRLEHELRIASVSLALMQTELFAPGSNDAIAAATKAEQLAIATSNRLPRGSLARGEVDRLKVDAILRSGQSARAETAFERLVEMLDWTYSQSIVALRIRLDLALRRLDDAQKRLDYFYGTDPRTAPPSIEMDLVRLEYLIAKGGDTGGWLDDIEARGGPYAKRRAELLLLSRSGTSDGSGRVDPATIAAQGRTWLRQQQPVRAAELLAIAAKSDQDSNRAIRHAAESAAAYIAAQRPLEAADVLANVSSAHPDGRQAAQAHLQAIHTLASTRKNGSSTTDQIEALLRDHLQRWPSSSVASGARQWLSNLLQRTGRTVEAAEIISSIDPTDLNDATLDAIYRQWHVAFHASDQDQLDDVSRRCAAALKRFAGSDRATPTLLAVAALLLQRDDVAQLVTVKPDASERFLNGLIRFRTGNLSPASLPQPPDVRRDDALWRLMNDGRRMPERRTRIARAVQSWPATSPPSFDLIERHLWLDEVESAIESCESLLRERSDPQSLQQAARVFAASRSRRPREYAVEIWDRLAAGAPQGSDVWHQSKLAAIELLNQLGDVQQSQRRAQYVLLTVPGMDPSIQQRYLAVAGERSESRSGTRGR